MKKLALSIGYISALSSHVIAADFCVNESGSGE